MDRVAVNAVNTDNPNFWSELWYNIRKRFPDLIFYIEPLAAPVIVSSKEVDVLSILYVNSDEKRELRFVCARWDDIYIGYLLC